MKKPAFAATAAVRTMLILVCALLILVISLTGCANLLIQSANWLIQLDLGGQPVYIETRAIEDYGNYSVHAEEFINRYITRFFPEEISEEFQNVQYVFHSGGVDEYAFEAYLEFTFDSDEELEEHVESATNGMVSRPFYFDESYQEYCVVDADSGVIFDSLTLGKTYTPNDSGFLVHEPLSSEYPSAEVAYQINYALISKILINYEERRVIYVAMAVHDGGGMNTSCLWTYFERFQIDPKEYAAYTHASKEK